jgi:dimethylhistidine N-methyltransferase
MSARWPSPRYTLIETDRDEQHHGFADAVRAGLSAPPRSIPCRFLYDEAGSRLFEEICRVPEYYLTRVERGILASRAPDIAALFDGPIVLAELGSGNSAKTRLLIEALLHAHGGLRYVPVDVSRSALEESAQALLGSYDGLEVRAIASEYHVGLHHVRRENERPRLVVWLGSSIGNLTREEAAHFLGRVRASLAGRDRMLVGIDLRKDRRTLEAAYDDSAGVTARFSLNLLARINRELGGDFDLRAFRHVAVYHEDEGRVEIRLVSQKRQRVRVRDLDLDLDVAAGEGIHTENAFKYSRGEIDALAAAAGLAVARRWLDAASRFALLLLAPA